DVGGRRHGGTERLGLLDVADDDLRADRAETLDLRRVGRRPDERPDRAALRDQENADLPAERSGRPGDEGELVAHAASSLASSSRMISSPADALGKPA